VGIFQNGRVKSADPLHKSRHRLDIRLTNIEVMDADAPQSSSLGEWNKFSYG
jgi:hypothetical protein